MIDRDVDDDTLPCVPFVPFLCPWCGAGKPRTTGQNGRKRYHRCQECGRQYLSWQLDCTAIPGWDVRRLPDRQ